MKTYTVGIIGLGGMGRKMMASMEAHQQFRVTIGWDPSDGSCNAAKEQQPDLLLAEEPDAVISHEGADLIYIAGPPKSHREYALKVMEAGKPIFCEKPLGVDVTESRDLVEQAQRSELPNIVNFNHGAAISASVIKEEMIAGKVGDIAGVNMHLHVPQWPRAFQTKAGWLKGREQGGFCREVFSHWIYLTRKLLGQGILKHANVHYPADGVSCEIFVEAGLDFGGIPVFLSGITGGTGPVGVEYTLWGEKKSFHSSSGGGLMSSDGGDWSDALTHIPESDRKGDQRTLDAVIRVLGGDKGAMPDMEDGLAVQELVEGILAAGNR